jgi:hypothetical protein
VRGGIEWKVVADSAVRPSALVRFRGCEAGRRDPRPQSHSSQAAKEHAFIS